MSITSIYTLALLQLGPWKLPEHLRTAAFQLAHFPPFAFSFFHFSRFFNFTLTSLSPYLHPNSPSILPLWRNLKVCICLLHASAGFADRPAGKCPSLTPRLERSRVFFDIEIGGVKAGRVAFELVCYLISCLLFLNFIANLCTFDSSTMVRSIPRWNHIETPPTNTRKL